MRGSITITSNPSGAVVYLDSIAVRDAAGNLATTPVKITDIHEGDHGIKLSLVGYCPDSDHLYVFHGADLTYHRDLVPCY